MLKSYEEVAKLLSDREAAAAVMTKVNKGSKGSFDYIPWNETVKLLDRTFGPLGWSARVTDRQVHVEGDNHIYHVGLELTVRAKDEDGTILEVSRPGVGVGIASPNKSGVISADAHDTAAKGARSDALSTAAKMLGDAFGLYLYDRGDPARSEAAQNVSGQSASASSRTGMGSRPSEKQMAILEKNGYTAEQVAALDFKDWKAIIDAIFAKRDPTIAPAGKSQQKTAVAPKTTKPSKAEESEDDDLPF